MQINYRITYVTTFIILMRNYNSSVIKGSSVPNNKYGSAIRGYVWHTLPEAIIFYDCTAALARSAL